MFASDANTKNAAVLTALSSKTGPYHVSSISLRDYPFCSERVPFGIYTCIGGSLKCKEAPLNSEAVAQFRPIA